MAADEQFRIVLIIGSVILFPIGAYHRIRSQWTPDPLDRRQEGIFILVTLRLVGLAGTGGFLAYLINPRWVGWSSVPLPEWLRWTGVGIGALAGGLLVWALGNLGKNLTDTVVTRKEHALVTTGPYRWVRHPFYVAAALAFTANSLATANWFIALCGVLGFTLIVLRTDKEEAKLIERFGDEYRSYATRTGRFIPRRSRGNAAPT